jgi:hypothetical protein
MRKWPTSAVVALSVTLICGLIAVHQTYVRTKAAWYAAGQSNGSISARVDAVDRLRQSGVVLTCLTGSDRPRTQVVSVKTDTIYVVDDRGTPQLCE